MSVTQLASQPDDSPQSPTPTRFYLPELDSLRFFAFLAVFVWHLQPLPDSLVTAPHTSPLETLALATWRSGQFGVDLFFTLSAFLITELLTREQRQFDTLDIRAFYMRRILRIWPLYFGFLAALYIALALAPGAHVPWRALPAFAAFVGNFAMYRGVFVPLSLGILWSVSLEEQFYLLWPWVVARVSRRGMLAVAILMWLFSILFRSMLIARGVPPRTIWWNSFARLDPLACGIMMSVILRGSTIDLSLTGRRAIALASVMLIVFAGYCSPREEGVAMFWFTLAYPAAAVGCAGVVLAALGIGNHRGAWLLNPALKYLGRISYGLYVFHATMLILALKMLRGLEPHPAMHTAAVGALTLAMTISVAASSYRWFEKPFLRLKNRFQRVRSMPV
jgi:peptidoglycan/LPS O-acetylase OafA/YrhL